MRSMQMDTPVLFVGLKRPSRSHKKNKSLMETAA